MLKSLEIKNFRSLRDFEVDRLGQVNLIVGKNNSGKSTVLEALRLYAGNARIPLLREISTAHDEKSEMSTNENNDLNGALRFQHFFTGREFPEDENSGIVIGEKNSKKILQINHAYFVEQEDSSTDGDGDTHISIRLRRVKKSDTETNAEGNLLQALIVSGKGRPFNIFLQKRTSTNVAGGFSMVAGNSVDPCSNVPTQLVSMDQIANDWDKIALSNYEEVAKQALRIISSDFEDIVFVIKRNLRNDESDHNATRTAYVKLKGFDKPVPLNSMGEGMVRVLQLILKIFPAENGFLLIDEFENGLHYGVQKKIWELVFELAKKLNIQVFATTHSWDCVESFAKVANERLDIDGVLFRVGRSIRNSDDGKIIATVFDQDKLLKLTQSDVDVR